MNINLKNLSKHVLAILSGIGILLSIELTVIYYFANFVPNAAPSFCVLNAVIDCDAVARTVYSHVCGIPLAVYGLFFYIAIFILSLLTTGVNIPILKRLESPKSIIFSLSTVSVLAAITLAWISSMAIHKICILCYATYLLNIFLLIASKSNIGVLDNYKRTIKDMIKFVKSPLNFSFALVMLIVAIAALTYAQTTQAFVPVDPMVAMQKKFDVPTTSTNPTGNVLGDTNAKVVIREYTDLKCPYCAMSSAMMERLVSELNGVLVEHNDFPLDSECNKLLKRPIHFGSCEMARYTLAAKKQNKYWDMLSAVFNNQQKFEEINSQPALENQILDIAKSKGLDIDKLKADANSQEIISELNQNVADANKLSIKATPTLFIGIKKYEGIMPYPELKNLAIQAGATPKQ